MYNACTKALAICEAAARYPEQSQESERIKAAKEAENNTINITAFFEEEAEEIIDKLKIVYE